jgi:aminopeptidase N
MYERMSRKWYLVLAAVLCLPFAWWIAQRQRVPALTVTPTLGISQELAAARKLAIGELAYDLTLSVPEKLRDPVRGRVQIKVRLLQRTDAVLDFSQPASSVTSILANGHLVPVRSEYDHLVIPAESLRAGDNLVEIAFTAGDDALNRNADYLYSLFVPARASKTFPCFDQPDLKATLALTLEIPSGWVALANGPEIARRTSGTRTTLTFLATKALPTYLFGFAAGTFVVERGERNGRPFYMYHRETDKDKVSANREIIFDLHQQAIGWLEEYTDRKYPFEKLDFVLLPAFQFAGMEHAGAIFYNAPSLLLEKTATQEQQLSRANTIAHETAHMWFGDLVTMKWFDDVWMKEVFANFMAAKIVNPSFPTVDHDLRFLLQHYPSAYDVDRTSGANPIRQTLDNLNEAGSLYGPIIYDKAPIVMRQLERMLGEEAFQGGIREYLARYAFGNAAWTDLIEILDRQTDEDLAAWSHAWVDEPGRPMISTRLKVESDAIVSLNFAQTDARGRSLVWNQRLQIALGYESGARITSLKMNAPSVDLADARGLPAPHYILPNGEGVGYGLFELDDRSRQFFLDHLPEIGDGITRATAWLTLWDAMLEGDVAPRQLAELMLRALPVEHEEQNVQRILTYLGRTYWVFLDDTSRLALAPRMEESLRRGIRESAGTSMKSAYFTAFRRTATTASALAYLERVWRRQEETPGLTFAETDYIAMAQELALRNVRGTEAILTEQLKNIANPDRRSRFAFTLPALSPDESVRDGFFAGLSNIDNRRHEPWVLDGLSFLNHPLRRRHAERYIEPSLKLLSEIQRTGDIFFPTRWTQSVLDGHNSPAAAQTVTAFLAAQKDFPARLRQVVEQSADMLFRAARIVI